MLDSNYTMSNKDLGIAYISEFLEGLIIKFRKKGISSVKLITLSKTLCFVENFERTDFMGEITLQAGYSVPDDHSEYYILSVRSDGILLTQEGFAYTPGAGSDSYGNEIFDFSEDYRYPDAEERLQSWIDSFMGMSKNGSNFTVYDDVEDFTILDEDDIEDDDEDEEFEEDDLDENDDELFEDEKDKGNYSGLSENILNTSEQDISGLIRTRNNKWTHGPANFIMPPPPKGFMDVSGIYYLYMTIDQNVGDEVVLIIYDPTDFVYDLKNVVPFRLLVSSFAVNTTYGPVFTFLFWIQEPGDEDKAYAIYDKPIDISIHSMLQPWARLAKQTYVHLFLLDKNYEVAGFYEFENNFAFEESLDTIQNLDPKRVIDFAKAQQEYFSDYSLEDLYEMFSGK